MVRAVVVLIVFAVLASVQCSGACLVSACADSHSSSSCHHNQKKTMQRCEHRPLLADEWTSPQQNPLAVAAPFVAALTDVRTLSSASIPLALSPSPHLFSPPVMILKI